MLPVVDDAEAYYDRGRVKYKIGYKKEAIKDYKQLLSK